MIVREESAVANTLWYKDAIIYELHVKAFCDSDGDGVGDFRGLTQKLDYLEGLGITAIWLLPFYPSPLRDDGYDISDYMKINPDYGNMRDFREFLRQAHKRNIRVITELVLNHTSDQHPWFQRARKSKKDSVWRDFYVWSDTPEKYKDARIIFQDFESSNWTWDPVAKAHYWHRFYYHQPDLNFANPHVQKALLRAVDYWFGMGVDGLRLDAVPYLFEMEGTNCENLPETYEFLRRLRAHIDRKHSNKMLLAEANQWPEDAMEYFGSGDICHMAFHFPLMPRIFMASWMEDRFPIIDIFDQTPSIPGSCQWALFLRNHDELTLEMVTDEERDYMYRVYAQDPTARINLGIRRRLSPLLGNNRRKIELMNILLFSLPGTPVIYYGDEIGMGDNYYLGDRDGVRTPMQWSSDRNSGFSRANPQQLYLPVIIDPEYHYEAMNVEAQERNQSSLLWWMKRVITMRKNFQAFGRGSIEFLHSENPKVLAFLRHYGDEIILIIVNLSRFPQVVELDLSRYAGYHLEEIFSRNDFPVIRESPYIVTLGTYEYYWFEVRPEEALTTPLEEGAPEISVRGRWGKTLSDQFVEVLEKEVLLPYLFQCRWFRSKAQRSRSVKITETIPFGRDSVHTHLLFMKVKYYEGEAETYVLPLTFGPEEDEQRVREENPRAIIAYLRMGGTKGILYDGVHNNEFREDILTLIFRRQSLHGLDGQLTASRGSYLKNFRDIKDLIEESSVIKAEQTNTSFLYGDSLFFKMYRKIESGLNPDLEMTRFLSEKSLFTNLPLFAGALEYKKKGSDAMAVGMLQSFVPNQGDAWTFSLHLIEQYYERVLAKKSELQDIPSPFSEIDQSMILDIPDIIHELIGAVYFELIGILGSRTAELHQALASTPETGDFAPEPFSLLYQRSLFQSMQSLTKRSLDLLRKRAKIFTDVRADEIQNILVSEHSIIGQFRAIHKKKLSALRTRIHGDYHLAQVLFTGNDFVIIDFEGEPARPISERRIKRSPLVDVAGMLRSFQYAAFVSLYNNVAFENVRSDLEPWALIWSSYVGRVFLDSYHSSIKDTGIIPEDPAELFLLLRAFLMEKAVYEIAYELNNRPDWVIIPIKGIQSYMEREE